MCKCLDTWPDPLCGPCGFFQLVADTFLSTARLLQCGELRSGAV